MLAAGKYTISGITFSGLIGAGTVFHENILNFISFDKSYLDIVQQIMITDYLVFIQVLLLLSLILIVGFSVDFISFASRLGAKLGEAGHKIITGAASAATLYHVGKLTVVVEAAVMVMTTIKIKTKTKIKKMKQRRTIKALRIVLVIKLMTHLIQLKTQLIKLIKLNKDETNKMFF
jgi:hypothetical protein